MQVIPEQFKEACVEVDAQEGQAEPLRDVVVVSQTMVDGPGEAFCPLFEG